ncbi:hypothetical protein PMALA_056990 [Plasmodium malariae]|uniref:Uncharacterized protein n=1 Tax=Plasmodium malariae TaxID=5858 RepID=A0A1A8WZE1_PLAMA|nr:hypothetical protein PMALA_056990 [Plasmodium malariae]
MNMQTCLSLAEYIIKEKTAPPYTEHIKRQEVLNNHFEPKFDKLTKYGGYTIILDNKERILLQLKYEADDFSPCDDYNDCPTKKKEYFKRKKERVSSKKEQDQNKHEFSSETHHEAPSEVQLPPSIETQQE